MKSIKNRRLRAPIAMLASGAVLAAVGGISQGWGSAIGVMVVTIAAAVYYYAAGGRDSDYGALIGDRADERQALINTRAEALSGTAVYAAAVIGAIVALALRGPGHWGSYWPFGLVIVVGTVSYCRRGREAGFGALIGGRADERQALIRTRALARTGSAMIAAAVIVVLIVFVLGFDHHLASYWSCQLPVIVGAVSYLAGLRIYGAHGADYTGPGDDADERAPGAEPILTHSSSPRTHGHPGRQLADGHEFPVSNLQPG